MYDLSFQVDYKCLVGRKLFILFFIILSIWSMVGGGKIIDNRRKRRVYAKITDLHIVGQVSGNILRKRSQSKAV